jgi:hypothetical protein
MDGKGVLLFFIALALICVGATLLGVGVKQSSAKLEPSLATCQVTDTIWVTHIDISECVVTVSFTSDDNALYTSVPLSVSNATRIAKTELQCTSTIWRSPSTDRYIQLACWYDKRNPGTMAWDVPERVYSSFAAGIITFGILTLLLGICLTGWFFKQHGGGCSSGGDTSDMSSDYIAY